MPLLISDSHTKLLKEKTLKILPKYERTEDKVGLRGPHRIIFFEIASH